MKMRILGLTLMAFFLFNGAALAAEKVDKDHGKYVSSMAKGHTGSMKAYVHMNFIGSTSDGDSTSGSDDSGSTSGDGDSNSTVDDVTGDLMDGFF